MLRSYFSSNICMTVLCCVLCWVFAQESQFHPDDDNYVPFEGERFDAFDWTLCKAIDSREPGNVVISPIGVKLVLAMLYEGAAGTTAQEIREILQLPVPKYQSRNKFSAILRSLQMTRNEYVFDIGSKMYVSEVAPVKERFTRILNIFYNTEVQKVNFQQSRETVSLINKWVDTMTHGHIQDMVTEDEITPYTSLLLLNAIYFKGLWRHPFPANATQPGPFYLTPEKTISVDYMTVQDYFYYSESDVLDAKILRMPYMGKKFSMFLVLPNKHDGLTHLLHTVSPTLIKQHLKQMTSEDVEVVLPKFNFDFTSHLKDVLQQIGIKEIFEDDANLQGITLGYNTRLSVSTMLQKAGLEVTEQGTTAFGATEVNLPNKIGSSYDFHATHPFMFFIEDENTGTVIFIGKVVQPTLSTYVPIPNKQQPMINSPVFPEPPKKPKPTKKPQALPEEGGISAVGIFEEPVEDYYRRTLLHRIGDSSKPSLNNILVETPPKHDTEKIEVGSRSHITFPDSNIIWDHLRNRWYGDTSSKK